MKELFRKYWWGLLFIVVVVVTPIIINWMILQPKQFFFVGDGTHWLGFWATYIGAIASFAMVLITWFTLKQNKISLEQNEKLLKQNNDQLEELKRQWKENNRARLSFSIIASQTWYHLKITNTGTETAYNINLIFENDFINTLPQEVFKSQFININNRPFAIEGHKSNYYTICSSLEKDFLDKDLKIIMNGSYCDRFNIDESLSISEYITKSTIVNDDLTIAVEYMKKGIIVQNDQYMPIQKSLHKIAEKLEKIEIE